MTLTIHGAPWALSVTKKSMQGPGLRGGFGLARRKDKSAEKLGILSTNSRFKGRRPLLILLLQWVSGVLLNGVLRGIIVEESNPG